MQKKLPDINLKKLVTFLINEVNMNSLINFFKFDFSRSIGFLISLILCATMALLFSQTVILDGMERGSYDWRFKLRNPQETSKKLNESARYQTINPRANDKLIILGIDENTIREFGKKRQVWPFTWDIHAKFTRFVGTGQPEAIFFDIMFLDPRNEKEKHLEKIFSDAIKEAKVVFIDYAFEAKEKDVQYNDLPQRLKQLEKLRFPVAPNDMTQPWVEEVLPPLPILTKTAKGIGYANVRPDADHVNRKMPLIIKYKNWYYPNIDLTILMNYYGIKAKDVKIKMGEYIKLTNCNIKKMKKPNKERTITIPINKYGFMDINFIGGPGSFRSVSYYYFVEDGNLMKDGNESLKGKIALIGVYATAGISKDVHKSPYGETFGIEHHANAINTILNQDFINKLSQNQNIIILIIIALILGFFLPRVTIISSVIIMSTLAISYVAGAYLIFDKMNIVIAFTTPLVQIATSFSFIIAFRVVTEQKEKKIIRQTFSKFVSKTVVDELLKDPEALKLGGEKKVLTVLFSDIRGFTSISEKLTPEQLVEHLNVYLQSMTDMGFKYDGTLDKYVGDEIMAFWGAPLPLENHALLACKSALKQMEALHKLNEQWEIEEKPPLNIGIGVNTGDMVVGNMGSTSRMDYTLMGDNVNLGARLEGTNKVYGTNIIISEYTYEHVKEHVVVRELDLIKVKGKELPVRIYELLDVVE